MTFILTADDYGLNATTTEAIQKMIVSGEIKSVSVLVNTKYSSTALEKCKLYPNVEWGIHLNIVEGMPITRPDKIPSLVDKNGRFYPLPLLLLKLFLSQIDIKHLELEFENQISLLQKYSTVTHINSHQNTHLFPPIWFVVRKIAHTYGIKNIRHRESVKRRLTKFPFKYSAFYVLWFAFWLKYGFRNYPKTTNAFTEILVHPGTNYD